MRDSALASSAADGRAVSTSAPPVLSVRELSKSFGSIAALKGVEFDLAAGEIRAICGENGAGKSTLVKILMGVYQPDAGQITIAGQPSHLSSTRDAQALGMTLVAQELSVCPDLSVVDNIWLGSIKVPFLHQRSELRRQAREALELLGIAHIPLDATLARLSLGERQLIEIARMLTRDARILLLDEPTATLSDQEIERILAALLALKRQGRSVIYITHRLAEVFQICDSVTVLRNGQLVATCDVADVDRKALIEMMLGRPFVEMYPEHEFVPGDVALQIKHLSVPGVVEDFSLSVPRGDIVCIAGQVGSGAETVIRAVAGLVYNAAGSVFVNGKAMALGSSERAVRHHLRFVSGERAEEGIFRSLHVRDNLVATQLRAYARCGLLNPRSLTARALSLAQQVGVDAHRMRARADELSGGNQQKLAFGRSIGDAIPGVIVMIEPTRGVDVGARAEIYQLMRNFCKRGYGLLVFSTDLEEVVGLGDMVVTLYRGRQVASYRGNAIRMEQITADIIHPVR